MRYLFLALALVGCTKAKDPVPAKVIATPRVDATAEAGGALATNVDAGWQSDPPKTWTDPRVIDGLAADCSFVPPQRVAGPGDMGRAADLFRCTVAYNQACMFDPCIASGEQCKNGCGTTCSSCGSTCSDACSSCKAGCTDDACKRTCAASCADCKQTCTRTMDRCTSGTCSNAYSACGKELRAAYKANGCAASCAAYEQCVVDCNKAPNVGSECWEKCTAKRDAKYSECRKGCSDDAGCIVKCLETSGCPSSMCALH